VRKKEVPHTIFQEVRKKNANFENNCFPARQMNALYVRMDRIVSCDGMDGGSVVGPGK
jgi:hypothetical protein